MRILLVLIFLTSCSFQTNIVKPKTSNEAKRICAENCIGDTELTYRNKTTYFCYCKKNKKHIVIGKMGTIYK
jgi:hypothetical protein